MKVGDLIQELYPDDANRPQAGIIVEMDVNMWGEEVIPSGARIIWACDGDVSVINEDEIEVISEGR